MERICSRHNNQSFAIKTHRQFLPFSLTLITAVLNTMCLRSQRKLVYCSMWIEIQQTEQYADIYSLQNYSTYFGCHSTHHQEYQKLYPQPPLQVILLVLLVLLVLIVLLFTLNFDARNHELKVGTLLLIGGINSQMTSTHDSNNIYAHANFCNNKKGA